MSFINNNAYFPELISEELKKLGLSELENPDKKEKIHYCDISYGKRNDKEYQKCEIVNQLANVDPLGNKKDQYNIHLNYYKERPKYIPMTISFLKNEMEKISNLFTGQPRESPKSYIVKPENSLSRRGVGIVRNDLELRKHLGDHEQYDEWIIQDYIDNPLLFNKKKFHFRIYVIFIQTPEYQVAYLGKRGFMYTANKEFQKNNFDNDVVLSGENAAENVFYCPDDFAKEFGKKKWEDDVFPQIVKITRETLKSALEHLECPNKNSQKCFKILGYDILINSDFECYLAEINARNVSYKYPNEDFSNTFYKYILRLVLQDPPFTNQELKQENIPYERILFKKDGEITEGFQNFAQLNSTDDNIEKNIKFNNFYWRVVYPFLVFIVFLIVIQIILRH